MVTFYAGLRAIRLMPLFVLIAIPLVAVKINDSLAARTKPPRTQPLTVPPKPRIWLNAALVLGMVFFVLVHTRRVILNQPQAEQQYFPARAVAFLGEHSPTGPIFNHYDWGGYLIWKLYPGRRVFIDGRADLYGEQFFAEFARTYQLKNDWQRPLRQWKVTTVLVPSDSALAQGLRGSPNWMVAYEDNQAVILSAVSVPGAGKGVTVGMQEITPLEQDAGYYEGD